MNRKAVSLKKCNWQRHFLADLLMAWGLALLGLGPAFGQENAPHPGFLQEPETQETQVVEVRLRAQAELTEPIVRLSHLAELFPAQSPLGHRLAQTELLPAPAPGARRYLSATEIEEILLRRGLPVGQVRLTGASQVEIRRQKALSQPSSGTSDAPASASGSAGLGPVARRRTESALQNALLAYLEEKVPGQTGWQVKLAATHELQKILRENPQVVEVRGGSPPWTGVHWFELILNTSQGRRSVLVQAEVSLATAVVVAARPIPKGTLLQPQDLALLPLQPDEKTEGYFQEIQQLVGKEALRGLLAGRPIPQDAVQAPLLVRRGQVVTVYARAPGIRVRTQARAKEDGSLGDLVAVESLADRKTYFARVCGLQEVEVFARGVHTHSQWIPSETASLVPESASPKTQ